MGRRDRRLPLGPLAPYLPRLRPDPEIQAPRWDRLDPPLRGPLAPHSGQTVWTPGIGRTSDSLGSHRTHLGRVEGSCRHCGGREPDWEYHVHRLWGHESGLSCRSHVSRGSSRTLEINPSCPAHISRVSLRTPDSPEAQPLPRARPDRCHRMDQRVHLVRLVPLLPWAPGCRRPRGVMLDPPGGRGLRLRPRGPFAPFLPALSNIDRNMGSQGLYTKNP